MKNKYRLSISPALEVARKEVAFSFKNLDEMLAAKNTTANVLLFLHDIKAMYDYSNMFVMEEWDGSEWLEIDEYDMQPEITE